MEYENPIGDFFLLLFRIYFGFDYQSADRSCFSVLADGRLIPAKYADPLLLYLIRRWSLTKYFSQCKRV